MKSDKGKDKYKKLKNLEKLLEANLYLNSTPNLETLLGRIIAISKDVLEAYSTSIILVDEEKKELYFEKVFDAKDSKSLKDEKALKKVTLKWGEGIAGQVAKTGEPMIVNDVQSDPRYSPKGDKRTGLVTKNMIAIPLKTKDRVIGVMEVINKIEGDFTEDDLPMCLALGSVASVAIDNARLYFETESNLRRLARMEASKYQLVNLIFHALKTPISSVQRHAEFILESSQNINKQITIDFAEMTHREATNITKMINDLYVINEYDDLVHKLNLQPYNIAEIFQSLIKRRSILSRKQNYILDLGSETEIDDFVVEIDYDKIEHCLQHLFDIISAHNPKDSKILICMFNIPETKEHPPYIQIEIDEEGLTIPEDLFEKVFEAEQIKDEPVSAVDPMETIGLGLFICRKIFEAHSGQIYWQKKKGFGSRIFIILPK